jgi:hypothetical protein
MLLFERQCAGSESVLLSSCCVAVCVALRFIGRPLWLYAAVVAQQRLR